MLNIDQLEPFTVFEIHPAADGVPDIAILARPEGRPHAIRVLFRVPAALTSGSQELKYERFTTHMPADGGWLERCALEHLLKELRQECDRGNQIPATHIKTVEDVQLLSIRIALGYYPLMRAAAALAETALEAFISSLYESPDFSITDLTPPRRV